MSSAQSPDKSPVRAKSLPEAAPGQALRLPVRIANRSLRPWAQRLFPLSAQELKERVSQRTGLSDFGDDRFDAPLQNLLSLPDRADDYHPLGRYRLHHDVRRLLRTRLRLHDLIKRHPEIHNQTIDAPIFILGLPGSGSDHLHRLLCEHPALRCLPAWEAREPLPRSIKAEPDLDIPERERRHRQAQRRRRLALTSPWMVQPGATEATYGDEQELMGIEFSSLLLEMKYENPAYRRWRMTQPQRPAYETLRLLLQALQWLRGGERWILHSAQHIDQLEILLRVFPDARIVHVHRDPQWVCQKTTLDVLRHRHLARGARRSPQVGQLWLDRTESLLRSSIRTRMQFPDLPVTDIRFRDYMTDPIDIAEDCFTAFGESMPTTLRDEMKDFHAAADHGKHDEMATAPANHQTTRDRVEERLGFYRDFFSIAEEFPGWPESS
ncbi:MAG: sulfotransferase [Candidatus Binatia bacterium]|nr:sulfotransferase [Candidatus Binatia bacterium]